MATFFWIRQSPVSEGLLIIGDVHGDIERLVRMFDRAEASRRQMVLVGDYVNRGPSSAQVVEFLVAQKQNRGDALVLLAGNHELALMDYFNDGDFVTFARHGGSATVRSYVGDARDDVREQLKAALPASHASLLRDLEPCYETSDVLVSHAGYNPAEPDDRSLEAMTSSHPDIFGAQQAERPKSLVVCGHYVQRTHQPLVEAGLICLDTGCGTTNGPLTGVLLPEAQFVSV